MREQYTLSTWCEGAGRNRQVHVFVPMVGPQKFEFLEEAGIGVLLKERQVQQG